MSACLSVNQLCLLLCLSFYPICLWVISFNFHLHPSLSLSIFPILSSALPLNRNMQQTVVLFHPSKSISTSTSTSSPYSFFFTNRLSIQCLTFVWKATLSFVACFFYLYLSLWIACPFVLILLLRIKLHHCIECIWSWATHLLPFILFYFLILTTFQSPSSHSLKRGKFTVPTIEGATFWTTTFDRKKLLFLIFRRKKLQFAK